MLKDIVLTVVDTAAIQDYIFSSNQLRENLGASYLVEQATGDWVKSLLAGLRSNISAQSEEQGFLFDEKLELERDGLEAELVYIGGGNTVLLFRDVSQAKRFARNLSQRALEQAPGLQLVITHREITAWDPQDNDLRNNVRELIEGRLTEKKQMRQAVPMFQLGLGVTAKCSSTGLPAVLSNRGLEPKEARTRLRNHLKTLSHNNRLRLQKLFENDC
jgi:hypothetical protein